MVDNSDIEAREPVHSQEAFDRYILELLAKENSGEPSPVMYRLQSGTDHNQATDLPGVQLIFMGRQTVVAGVIKQDESEVQRFVLVYPDRNGHWAMVDREIQPQEGIEYVVGRSDSDEIGEDPRIVTDPSEPTVSRNHLHIVVDPVRERSTPLSMRIVDTSTNGTLVRPPTTITTADLAVAAQAYAGIQPS